jgi:hypothetical protein
MFGLPVATSWLVFGLPVFWILYLAGFLYVSRNWGDDNAPGDDGS